MVWVGWLGQVGTYCHRFSWRTPPPSQKTGHPPSEVSYGLVTGKKRRRLDGPNDGPNRQSPIASVQRTRSTHTNKRQSRDSNRSGMNAGSARTPPTKFCIFRGRYDRQRTLLIRIAAITLASDSAITLARFRPSKRR